MADTNIVQKDLGPVSAYAIAVKHGYNGTEEEWAALQIASAENAKAADASAKEAAETLAAVHETVEQETTAAVAAVNNQATASIQEVQGAAQAAGAQQEEAIAAKGEQTLASIPDDYTKLGQDVAALTEEIGEQQTEFDKVVDACCDKTVIGGEINYNLLKISECTFSHRLQDDSAELVASNANNAVSGWIPVKYGKHYTLSALINGERTTKNGTNTIMIRVNARKKDGAVITGVRGTLASGVYSSSTITINSDDITAVQLHISLGFDISTPDKLRATEIMFVEGDTYEQAYESALTLAYIDGDEEEKLEYGYTIKSDETKGEKVEVRANRKLINTRQKYDGNFIPNDRFIRGIANLRNAETAKDFDITITNNSGGIIKNAAIAVGLHNTVGINPANNNLPFQIYDDMFTEPIGFKFFDTNRELPYYIESESDCNYIVDKNIKNTQKTMAVFSDGKIAVYAGQSVGMQITDDDGATWTSICRDITGKPYRVLLPDSQDNLFVASSDGKKLFKYTTADGYMSGTQVINLTNTDTQIGSILAEDSDGNLYLGTYQTVWHSVVRKSTDHGDTWTVVFDSTESQHVHNIFINKKVIPNEIFISMDGLGDTVRTYVSTDAGVTWNMVDVPYNNRDYAFRYAGENFYIGCGERNVLGGATLYKTTDYTNPEAYYPLFDNGQGIRDITNVNVDSDDVLIAGGCIGEPVMTEQLFLSEDRGETWKTVLMRPFDQRQYAVGLGLRMFSRIDNQILSESSSGYAMRFVYGNGAKTTMVIVNVGDIPAEGKTITLKTGYVANVEQVDKVLTAYENIDGKVADIRFNDGYVIDMVSNKRVMTTDTEISNVCTKLGQTSEYKILANHAHKLNGSVNLGKLSRLNFTKGFTVSLLFRKEDGKDYISDGAHHVIFRTGDTKLVMHRTSICLMHGTKNIYKTGSAATSKLYINNGYMTSVNEDYVRVTVYFTEDELPKANIYTDNIWLADDVLCEEYPITVNLSDNDFVVGDANDITDGLVYGDIPNIARIEIYNRVLTHGEILSLTNGCNLVTDGSQFN